MISYGTPSEIKARIEDSEGGTNTDAADTYSGFIMNARQKVKGRGVLEGS